MRITDPTGATIPDATVDATSLEWLVGAVQSARKAGITYEGFLAKCQEVARLPDAALAELCPEIQPDPHPSPN